jgi:hypothetical protein
MQEYDMYRLSSGSEQDTISAQTSGMMDADL